MQGKIKFYNEEKGFGKIITDDKSEYFFHISKVKKAPKEIFKNDRVSFEEFETTKGLNAKNIEFKPKVICPVCGWTHTEDDVKCKNKKCGFTLEYVNGYSMSISDDELESYQKRLKKAKEGYKTANTKVKQTKKSYIDVVQKDMFETTEEYTTRINNMPAIEVGIARLKEYDADAEIYTIECKFHKEVVDLIKDLPVLNIKMKLPRAVAKELYLQGENHNIYAHITYDGSLFSMKEIGFNKYHISKLIETKRIEEIYKLSTYYDTTSGLTWQDSIDCVSHYFNWDDAMEYANNLRLGGYDDWFLPSKEQLVNLNNNQNKLKYNDFFYWSSSPDVSDSSNAWSVYVKAGLSYSKDKTNICYVRCARAGQ